MIRKKDMVFILGQMVENMKDVGRMESNMVRANYIMKKGSARKAYGMMEIE